MSEIGTRRRPWRVAIMLSAMLALGACFGPSTELPTAPFDASGPTPDYLVGPGDSLRIFVWRNPEVSTTVPVRPDGRISVPLIEDLPVTGKTPTQLAREIEKELGVFIQDPIVTVIVTTFSGPFSQQVRVMGEAARPSSVPYRANMTLLDLMIGVGGLTQFAAGNRAALVRVIEGEQKEYKVRIEDLIKDGDITANVQILPGDVLIIPQAWF